MINAFGGGVGGDHSDIVSFLVYHIRKPIMSTYFISGDVDFDHMVKVVCSRSHLYKGTDFFFVMNKYFVVRYFDTMQILFLIILLSTNFVFVF